jgi:hypothetical protein
MGWVASTHVLDAALVAIGLCAGAMIGPQSLASDAALAWNVGLSGQFAPFQLAQRPPLREIPRSIITDACEPGSLGARIVAAEGRPGQNPWSSAAGYGQFLSGTWLEIFRRAYPQLAQIMSREQILALREVKPLAEDLTNRYARANAVSLRQVGLPATDTTLSLAHAVGPGGAINILTSAPTRPVGELLSTEAIAANPVFQKMTASTLQLWAMNRIRPPSELQPLEAPAPRREDIPEPPSLAEDFLLGGHTKASEAWVANRQATALLENLLDAVAKTGAGTGRPLGTGTAAWLESAGVAPAGLLLADPATVRMFNRVAMDVVLDTIRSVSSRPPYRKFQAIERNAGRRGELSPGMTRELALALKEKMRQENATIANIVQHRRSSSDGRSILIDRPSRAFHAVSNGRGANMANPSR